jgi:NAD-dependent deacetylase
VQKAREWLWDARSVAVLTGAGTSAESGVPTFRGDGGLWRNFRPENLATPEAFQRDPRLVWEWYDWRRGLIAQAKPNPGHRALAAFEYRCENFTLVTQNVDGLHQRAGSRNVLCLHGDIWTIRCSGCGASRRDLTAPLSPLPPRCGCGALERPGVVWFGEPLPQDVWQAAESAVKQAEVLLVAGTSAAVHPAAGLVRLAQLSGAKVIEVNLRETPVTREADAAFPGPSGEILPKLLA